MSTATRVLAGIVVPDTPIIARAIDYAREHSEPYLFNHAMRSWLFGVAIAQLKGSAHDPEVLAVATLLHDIGLAPEFDGPLRFEVEGANAALAFARAQGMQESSAQRIWDGVALNSTPSIALYKEGEVALCTLGIGLDWGGFGYDMLPATHVAAVLDAFPRLPHRRIAPGYHLRQFRARFRRALRAGLHEAVDRGFSPELAVQGVRRQSLPASHNAMLRT